MKTYFFSFNIVDMVNGRGIVGCGNTTMSAEAKLSIAMIRNIENNVVQPTLQPGLKPVVMHAFEVKP
jgi:hypothetical protein